MYPRRLTNRWFVSVALVLCVACVASPVGATTIGLGDAGPYTVLALENSRVFMGNDPTTVNGDMGIAANSVGALDKGTVTGTTYIDPTASVTVGGSWVGTTAALNLSTAVADANTASGLFTALGGTPLADMTASLSLTGSGGDNVYALTNIAMNNKSLTLNGTASDYFIFNVTGKMDWLSSQLVLNGVSASHVLFNVTGTDPGDPIQLTNAAGLFQGTLLAPNRGIQADHLTINGQLIGGNATGFGTGTPDKDNATMSLHSEVTVNFVAFDPVPEPSALLGGMALFGLIAGRRGSRRQQAQ